MTFTLDPFQTQAIECIKRNESVLVSAPTGAGKTLIAEAAIRQAMENRKNTVYTAPIKALSNQKYRDFKEAYGEENVGILTGDVSINSDAPILIMTTEIYRNCLFEMSERIHKVGWVIFDEIHYLDDPERGTVWEEAILFTPPEIKVLALSATVPNVHELAEWMRSIHKQTVTVIEESHRPVPLEFIFHCQGQFHQTKRQLLQHGYLNREHWRLSRVEKRRGFTPLRAKPNRLDQMIRHVRHNDRLPMIYFVFGRKRAETLAWETLDFDFLKPDERERIRAEFDQLLERYNLKEERSAQEMIPLIERGVAFHHAGMLPSLKEVIERLFTGKLIKVIFTTETFALGINMPARSVVFDELDKYYGTGFQHLTTRDFYQMAGRAGRRGMDEKGFVYIRVQPNYISYPDVIQIIYGQPNAIRSQLNAAYATLLNLYGQLGERLMEIYPSSFHHWQSSKKRRRQGSMMIEKKMAVLKELECIEKNTLTAKGRFAGSLFGYELILTEMYFDKVLDDFSPTDLVVLLSGLIFEPRKGDHVVKLKSHHQHLCDMAAHYFQKIHRKEFHHKIYPYTKPPHFNLAAVVEAWAQGENFDKLFRITAADEGELVRHFRMIIQLLRELAHASEASEKIRASAGLAILKINRDVVDAEKQLRS
ncbi:MAG: DEAD/DEAH box helicase [Candidatus Omnitrophica bacterium]|nr:DEAD/DEAH box helicase [Candidatus Omnitrophota bacterium]